MMGDDCKNYWDKHRILNQHLYLCPAVLENHRINCFAHILIQCIHRKWDVAFVGISRILVGVVVDVVQILV